VVFVVVLLAAFWAVVVVVVIFAVVNPVVSLLGVGAPLSPQAFLSAWTETSVAASSAPFQSGQMLPEAFPEAFQANVARWKRTFSLRPLEIEAETDCQWMLDGEAAS
jgi:hypothetical protein